MSGLAQSVMLVGLVLVEAVAVGVPYNRHNERQGTGDMAITDEEITALQREADEAGNGDLANLCAVALSSWDHPSVASAREFCERFISTQAR